MLGIGGREDEFKGANTLREAAVDPLVVEQQKAAQAAQGSSSHDLFSLSNPQNKSLISEKSMCRRSQITIQS
jgi:hypothetical protein